MRNPSVLLSFAVLATSAYAHTIFQELWVNGVSQSHLVGIRAPEYNGPITDVTSNDVICNGGPNPLKYFSPVVVPVPAGAQVTAEFHHTLAGRVPSDKDDPIDTSHKGPVMAYLAKIPSATQSDVTGLKWFKIYQDGLGSDLKWGVDRTIANVGKVTFTIPKCVADGEYLLRVELIALHSASSYPGAQLYMECAQLKISGGGSANPATVSFPGAYAGSNPGITYNLYSGQTSYVIPGPSVFTCDGSTPPVTTPVTSTSLTSTVGTPTSTAAPPASTNLAAQWAQCGGDSAYKGPTACITPFKCVVLNGFYSQCQ